MVMTQAFDISFARVHLTIADSSTLLNRIFGQSNDERRNFGHIQEGQAHCLLVATRMQTRQTILN